MSRKHALLITIAAALAIFVSSVSLYASDAPQMQIGPKTRGASSLGTTGKLSVADDIGASGKDFSNVSLYTGDLTFPVALATVGGVEVKLQYNSNIFKRVRSDNRLSPSGWVGMGWSLNLGSIHAEISNTADVWDDHYYYSDGDGSSEIVQLSTGEFVLQDGRPWRITRDTNVSGYVQGWVIIKDDGTICRFGNYDRTAGAFTLCPDGPTFATRCYLGFDNHRLVMNPPQGSFSNSQYIAYGWDLSDVQALSGSHTTILYQQDTLTLKMLDNTALTSLSYTRESHPWKIQDDEGGELEFVQGTLTSDLFDGAYPPFTQNIFEQRYLQKLLLKRNGQTFRQVVLGYANQDLLGYGLPKWYLTSVQEQDGPGSNSLPCTNFSYSSGSNAANPGALEQITYPTGGRVRYGYKAQQLTQEALNDSLEISEPTQAGNGNLSNLGMTGMCGKDFLALMARTWWTSWGNSNSRIEIFGQPLRLYRWGPGGWFSDTLFRSECGQFSKSGLDRSDNVFAYLVGHDNIFLTCTSDDGVSFENILMRRTERGWNRVDVSQALQQSGITLDDDKWVLPIGEGPNYVVVLYNVSDLTNFYNFDVYAGSIAVIRLLPDQIAIDDLGGRYHSSQFSCQQCNPLSGVPYHIRASCGSNYFAVISCDSTPDVLENHFRWQDGQWRHLITDRVTGAGISASTAQASISVGSDFIEGAYPPDYMTVYRQTPSGVTAVVNYVSPSNIAEARSPLVFDRGYVNLSQGDGDLWDSTSINIWNGTGFDNEIIPGGNLAYLSATTVGGRLVKLLGDGSCDETLSYDTFAADGTDGCTTLGTITNARGTGATQLSASGSGYNSFYAGWYSPGYWSTRLRAYTLMGNTVLSTLLDSMYIPFFNAARFWQPGDNYVGSVFAPEDPSSGSVLPINRLTMFTTGSDAHGFPCFRGHPYDYVVSTKTVYSAMGDSTVTRYEFDSTRAVYDETMTTAKYNKATVYYPGSNGRTVSYFYNDLDGTQAEAFIPVNYFDELDGTCYRTRDYDQSGALLREAAHLYAVDAIDTVLSVFHQELLADTTTTDGLTSASSYVYNDRAHGYTLSSATETNSNGVKRISHMQYPLDYNISGSSPNTMVAALDSLQHGKHAASTLIEKWIVQDSAGVQKVLKGDLTTFRCVSSTQVLPDQVYSLRSSTPLTDFSVSNISGNPNTFSMDSRYGLVESFESYTSNGKLVQVRDANGVPSITKWGNNLAVPIATIRGADSNGCSAVDFEDGTIGDWIPWDWTPPYGSASTSDAHTGALGWSVPASDYEGVWKIIPGSRLTPNTSYTLSAWVKTSSTSPHLLWEVIYHDAQHVRHDTYPSYVACSGTGAWQYLESSQMLSSSTYPTVDTVNIFVLNGDMYTHAACTLDDIRFAPSNAIVQSSTYDGVTLLPTSTSDASNMPQYTTYDSFGRVIQVKDDQGRLLKDLTYYYSRTGHNDLFYSSDPNWTRTRIYRSTSDTTSVRTYTDGLGRTIQTETFLTSVNGFNFITNVCYDSLGRMQRMYKPYMALLTGSHVYDPSFSSNASSYYTNMGVALGGYPYSETQYQANPLNRVQKQSAPGATYALGSGKEVKMDYWSESSNKYFVTRKKDEQDQAQRTSTDLFGNTIQTVTDSAGLSLTTSFTYNALGQLLSSTPPLGANWKSTYSYTTRGEMTSKSSPDAGTVQYLYDKAGRVRLVKDANHTGSTVGFPIKAGTIPMNQFVTGTFTLDMPGIVSLSTGVAYQGPPTDNITLRVKKNGALIAQVQLGGQLLISLPRGTFTYEAQTPAGGNSLLMYNVNCSNCLELIYMKYDAVGRLVEEGEYQGSSATADFTQANADNTSWPATGRVPLKTLTYDLPSTDPVASGQRNLHGQVSTAASYGITMFYSYNSRGEVEWVVRKDPAIANTKLYYDYDLAGNLARKRYVDLVTSANNHYFFYEYDEVNRLARMYSGTDSTGVGKVKEAEYQYQANGTVSQVALGATPAQTVSYKYTERDWVREINAPKFMERMHYCNTSSPGLFYTPQYNGNIAVIIWRTNTTDSLCYNFLYDKANRLTTAASFSWSNPAWGPSNNYGMPCIKYDANGNIDSLYRAGSNGTAMDRLKYRYLANSNRLDSIHDVVASGSFSSDIDNQPAHNYQYDGNGNVSAALGDSIGCILYDLNNQPTGAYTFKTSQASVTFRYDANGMRTQKAQGSATISYILGLGGTTEAVVTGSTSVLYNFWAGAENVGQAKRSGSTLSRYYYLKDHLGSTRVSVTTTGTVDSYFDYYPYGQLMDGRCGTASADARYKYVSMERDGETNSDYNHDRTYGFLIGRSFQVDPFAVKDPSRSPYSYAGNNPILYYDANGDSVWVSWHTGFLWWGTDHKALYHDGKLYENGEEYHGNNSFVSSTMDALDRIGGSQDGQVALDALDGSSDNFTITKGNSRDGNVWNPNKGGNGGTISWDPSISTSGLDDAGSYARPSFIGLAHEIGHAYNLYQAKGAHDWGLYDESVWYTDPKGKDIPKIEIFAMKFENRIRSACGIPSRRYYESILLPNGGFTPYEKSKLVP